MISDKDSKKILVVIPARGGSTSIPRKNLSPLLGIPLIAYTISTALKLDFVDRVIVSSDDAEIQYESLKYGAEVIERSPEISQTLSRDNEMFDELLERDQSISNRDIVLFLRPTHPIRNPDTLKKAFLQFDSSPIKIDSLRSMKENKEIIFKSWGIGNDGLAIPAFNSELTSVPDPCNAPRQLLPVTYYQDGYIDIFPISTVKEFGSTCGNKVMPFLINEFSEDIDYSHELSAIENYLLSKTPPDWFTFPKPIS